MSLKKGLGETDVLKLRMSEESVAEDALRSGDVVGTKESLVAGFAGGFSAVRALNLFAIGSIEVVGTYIACHMVVMIRIVVKEVFVK